MKKDSLSVSNLIHYRESFLAKQHKAAGADSIQGMHEQGYFIYLQAIRRINSLLADKLGISTALVDWKVYEIKTRETNE